MKRFCRICGVELKTEEEDLCENCFNESLDEEMESDLGLLGEPNEEW